MTDSFNQGNCLSKKRRSGREQEEEEEEVIEMTNKECE